MRVISDLALVALMHPAGERALDAPRWNTWTVQPGVLLPLLALVGLYAAGVRRLWRQGGPNAGIARWQVGCFAAGCASVVAALMSPIDAMSAGLSSAHMVQHELLMIVAAPLLVVGAPVLAVLFAFSLGARRWVATAVHTRAVGSTWAVLSAPAAVWLLHAIALWTWHVPVLYQAALGSEAVHALEHACFFGTAALFWWGIARGRYGRMSYGAAVVYVFATALHSGLLGAALTLSPSVWYPAYAATTTAWGLTPLEDQQIAGLIMWVPAGVVFTVVGLLLFAAWLRESERRSRFIRTATLACLVVAACVSSACGPDPRVEAAAMTGGDPGRGRDAINRYGCDTCHTIPGVATARGKVGPPLAGVASRVYLAGHLPNTPDSMQDWIQHPHAHNPETVMPETGITPQDARDVAAYLYTLR